MAFSDLFFLWLVVPAWKTVSNTRIRYTVLEFVKKLRNWLTENHSATMLSYKGRQAYSFSSKWKQIDVVSNALVAKKRHIGVLTSQTQCCRKDEG